MDRLVSVLIILFFLTSFFWTRYKIKQEQQQLNMPIKGKRNCKLLMQAITRQDIHAVTFFLREDNASPESWMWEFKGWGWKFKVDKITAFENARRNAENVETFTRILEELVHAGLDLKDGSQIESLLLDGLPCCKPPKNARNLLPPLKVLLAHSGAPEGTTLKGLIDDAFDRNWLTGESYTELLMLTKTTSTA